MTTPAVAGPTVLAPAAAPRRRAASGARGDHQALHDAWEDRPGLGGWIRTVDHKRIGVRYAVTALTFLLIGGLEALALRTQLAVPDNDLLGHDAYNQLMTMHGTTMLLWFNTPMFAAFGNYLIPLQIGARDMAFPRLNALSYWIFLLSGLFVYTSFAVGEAPDGGWFAYTPLTSSVYSPGRNLDFWAIGITFLGISTTVGGINFIVTILRMRAPGMSLARLPIFGWTILTMSFMIIFALPAVTLAGALLEADRALGMHLFDPNGLGDPLLYQHLFWIWGHPEVYIVFIPATGIISTIIPTFARRPLAAHNLVIASVVATGFISFGLWVHHMFAAGLPFLVASFFSAASLVIAIPSGIQVLAWLTTLVEGRRPRLDPPLLFALGFIVTFVLGGFTGVMVAVVPFDQAITDSYFVVAHFHYVLIGGSVMPIMAGLYFWFPKVTGKATHPWLGRAAFAAIFVGFHVTFFPQHILGLMGMPRRVYTYGSDLGWDWLNLLSSIGAFVLAAGFVMVAVDLVLSWWRGDPAPDDPWGGETLEWALPSPPPPYNFAAAPVVTSPRPLWGEPEAGDGSAGDADGDSGGHGDVARATGHPAWDPVRVPVPTIERYEGEVLDEPPHGHHRAVLTSVLDATDVHVVTMPGPSTWPLALAAGVLALSTGVLLRSGLVVGLASAWIAWSFYRWHREAT
ncbi:MAG: cytochrome c oxidase subunit I [Acidimicrobiales bacterium]